MTLGLLVLGLLLIAHAADTFVINRDTKIRREHARKRHEQRMGERD